MCLFQKQLVLDLWRTVFVSVHGNNPRPLMKPIDKKLISGLNLGGGG